MDIVVYGAGYFARKYLSRIKEQYNIICIVDCDERKWGEQLEGITIVQPNVESLKNYPVLILIKDIKGALKTIKTIVTNVEVYWLGTFMAGFSVIPLLGAKCSIDEIVKNTKTFLDEDAMFGEKM